jgi:sulfite reductase (ferredoxin)
LLKLVKEVWPSLKSKSYKIDRNVVPVVTPPPAVDLPAVIVSDQAKYEQWLQTNVFEQKQKGYYGVYLKVLLGDLNSDTARQLADIVDQYAADDIRVTVNQGYLLKFLRKEALPHLFNALEAIGLAEPGFDSVADITACPGTDTCNLGISNSTAVSAVLEDVIKKEYPDLIHNNDIKIKISGCPNSCGQHGLASIGFHGSSMRDANKMVVPSLQVLIGGGVDGNGVGRIAEKVIKVPSKRAPEVLRTLFDDYDDNRLDGEYYADYYARQGKMYFYHLLKPLADATNLEASDYQDWGHAQEEFKVEAGVGECAGVIIDLVATLVYEAEEKLSWAYEAQEKGVFADAIYHAHNAMVSGAKAMLLTKEINPSTQFHILQEFDKNFVESGEIAFDGSFREHVLQINQHEPDASFARDYIQSAADFLGLIKRLRGEELETSAA